MNCRNGQKLASVLVACLLANLTLTHLATAGTTNAKSARIELGNDEETFTFAGRCPSGASYQLTAYQKQVEGFVESFYDYQGPAGHGTVSTDTAPKVMAARICRSMAEIINKDYWR